MLHDILFPRAKFDFFLWYIIIIRRWLAQTRQRLIVIFSGFSCEGHVTFSLMIFTAHMLGSRMRSSAHTRVHWLTVLWYHLLVVTSTLFFYYNVLKSAGASSAGRRTSIIFRLVVHNRECCTIITKSILSWIHLSIFAKSETAGYWCRYVLGSWISFECDLRLFIALRVLLKLALTWFDNRDIVHEHASRLENASVLALIWFLYVHLCH